MGTAFPLWKCLETHRNSTLLQKRQRNFLLTHQRFTWTSLHFFTFTSDNTIREINWKPTFEIETKTIHWNDYQLTNSQLLISDFEVGLISNGSKTNSIAPGQKRLYWLLKAQPLRKHDSGGSAAIMQARSSYEHLSVCLSVCLSVKRVYCDKTNESSADTLIAYQRKNHLVFRHEGWLVENIPLYLKFWAKLSSPFQKGDFQSIFARSASGLRPSEKKFNYH